MKNVSNDLNVIRLFGNVISNFLPHINGMTNEICNKLSDEISIEREKMCKLIQQKLSIIAQKVLNLYNQSRIYSYSKCFCI